MATFPSSPFYRKLTGSEPLDPNSAKIVTRWSADRGIFFGSADPWSHPIYNGCATEYPQLTIKLRQWGNCNGMKIRLATTARPEGVASVSGTKYTLVSWGDGHLSVQEKDGFQYDLWQVREIQPWNGGIIEAEAGNRSAIAGNGFGGGSVLNHALGLGDIRGQDIANGITDQALFAICPQSNGQRNTAEFGPGGSGSNPGFRDYLPAMGQRLHYRITDAQVAAYPDGWQRHVARRFKDHGIVFADTGGGSLKGESPLPWKTTGQVPPLQKLGSNFSGMKIDWSKVVAIKNGA